MSLIMSYIILFHIIKKIINIIMLLYIYTILYMYTYCITSLSKFEKIAVVAKKLYIISSGTISAITCIPIHF